MNDPLSPKALKRIHQLDQIEAAISEERTSGKDIWPLQSIYERMKIAHEQHLSIEKEYFKMTGRHL